MLSSNIRIPDGVELINVDGEAVDHVKAVDVRVFLGPVSAFPNGTAPDLAKVDKLGFDNLPVFVVPDVDGTIPEDAPLRYVEGVPGTGEPQV